MYAIMSIGISERWWLQVKKLCRFLILISIGSMAFLFLAGAINPEWKLVSKLEGTVEAQQANSTEWINVYSQKLVKDGDKARTLDKSRGKIQLADQSEVMIGANTTVEIARFQLKENARIVEIKLAIGRIKTKVSKAIHGESSFKVKTEKAVLAAKGTEFYVDVEKVGASPGQSNAGDTRLLAMNNGLPQSDSTNPAMGREDDEMVYFEVYDGQVQATTNSGALTFFAGDKGLITSEGAIIVNPSSIPSQFTSQAGWVEDQDLRQPVVLQEYTLGQPPTAPPGPKTGSQNPNLPPLPPVYIPTIETTGTIHINIR